MKKLVLILAVLAMSGCATHAVRIDSRIQVSAYNNIASSYMMRPTFVSVVEIGGTEMLRVEYQEYGTSTSTVNFVKEHIDSYIHHIEKYLKWEKIASTKRDQINKVIGDAALWAGASLQFSFYSGNATHHYLVVTPCGLGLCSGDPRVTLDRKNAIMLKELLLKYKGNQLRGSDKSAYQ